ncbi:uncharacterized protein [Haliotis asinina]|uniref:uncharacterized protein n=1 Tax=Haliotis asinina TaxID=109174 RepID=UPI003531EE86
MLRGFSRVLICTSLICFVSVEERLQQLEEDLLDNNGNMIRMEKRIRNIIDAVKTSLRVELKETIRDQVRETMSEIVQGEAFRDMVKSEVVSGLRHVRRGYHRMRRQLHHVSRSLQDFKDETATFHEFALKNVDDWNEQNTSDACAREKHRLERELEKSNVSMAELKKDNEQLNKTCQFQLKTAVPVSQGAGLRVNPTSTRPVLTKLVTTTSQLLMTASLTTPRQEEEKNRILIASVWSSTNQQFRQLNIHNGSLSFFPYHNMSRVTCIAYSAKTRELLIALYKPDRILASVLDTSQVRVLREGVRTYGMAVDEGRGVIFMGTHYPKYSISRMSQHGEEFNVVINLSMLASYPRQITLDTRREKIYWCNYRNLFTMTYDGQGLSTLARGHRMFSVTLDQKAGVLYYNKKNELMRMTVSNNVSTRVITLPDTPWNMRLYRGILYYGGWITSVLGTVNVTNKTGAYGLESRAIKGLIYPLVCLTP